MRQAQLCRNCRAEGTERESHACELDLAARKRGQLRTTVVAFPRRISTIGRRQAPLSQQQRRLIDGRLTLGRFLRLDGRRAGCAGEAPCARQCGATLALDRGCGVQISDRLCDGFTCQHQRKPGTLGRLLRGHYRRDPDAHPVDLIRLQRHARCFGRRVVFRTLCRGLRSGWSLPTGCDRQQSRAQGRDPRSRDGRPRRAFSSRRPQRSLDHIHRCAFQRLRARRIRARTAGCR